MLCFLAIFSEGYIQYPFSILQHDKTMEKTLFFWFTTKSVLTLTSMLNRFQGHQEKIGFRKIFSYTAGIVYLYLKEKISLDYLGITVSLSYRYLFLSVNERKTYWMLISSLKLAKDSLIPVRPGPETDSFIERTIGCVKTWYLIILSIPILFFLKSQKCAGSVYSP